MEQEVRKKRKVEVKFEPGKVFGLGAQFELGTSLDLKPDEDLETIAREAELDRQAARYRAKKAKAAIGTHPIRIFRDYQRKRVFPW